MSGLERLELLVRRRLLHQSEGQVLVEDAVGRGESEPLAGCERGRDARCDVRAVVVWIPLGSQSQRGCQAGQWREGVGPEDTAVPEGDDDVLLGRYVESPAVKVLPLDTELDVTRVRELDTVDVAQAQGAVVVVLAVRGVVSEGYAHLQYTIWRLYPAPWFLFASMKAYETDVFE